MGFERILGLVSSDVTRGAPSAEAEAGRPRRHVVNVVCMVTMFARDILRHETGLVESPGERKISGNSAN